MSSSAIKPYKYQLDTVRRIREFGGRALLGHEMGLGKTLCSLWYLREVKAFPTLIVCPASLKYTWKNEIGRLGLKSLVLESRKSRSLRSSLSGIQFVIINYDVLSYWIESLNECDFKSVVFDECHYLTNRRSKRTVSAKTVAKSVPGCLALSGTPLTNRPYELYPVLNLLRPQLFPSFMSYARRFCDPKWTSFGWDYSGASNLPLLHKILIDNVMIRYLKADVLKDLPRKVRRVVPVELSDYNEYRQSEEDFLGWLSRTGDEVKASRAIVLSKIGHQLRLSARLKLKNVVEYVNRFLKETNDKIVIFAVHRKCIAALQRRVASKSVSVTGDVTGKERQSAVETFQNDDSVRVFIGNIKAAGVGLTLTAANAVVFAELFWRPGDHLQAEDRIYRIGQEKTCFIDYFVGVNTIEEKVARVIQKKQKVLKNTLDGVVSDLDFDVYDQLIREIADG